MRWPLHIRQVVGDSMLPAYRSGEILLASGWLKDYSPGDVIIFRHDNLEKIKRIKQVEKGGVYVLGDNTGKSTDSRSFGWVEIESIVAKVIWPIKR